MKHLLILCVLPAVALSAASGADAASERIYPPVCGIEDGKYTEAPTLSGKLIGVALAADKGIEGFRKRDTRFLERTIRTQVCFYVGTVLGHHLFVTGDVGEDGALQKIDGRFSIPSKRCAVSNPRDIQLPQTGMVFVVVSDFRKIVAVDQIQKMIQCQQDGPANPVTRTEFERTVAGGPLPRVS